MGAFCHLLLVRCTDINEKTTHTNEDVGREYLDLSWRWCQLDRHVQWNDCPQRVYCGGNCEIVSYLPNVVKNCKCFISVRATRKGKFLLKQRSSSDEGNNFSNSILLLWYRLFDTKVRQVNMIFNCISMKIVQ